MVCCVYALQYVQYIQDALTKSLSIVIIQYAFHITDCTNLDLECYVTTLCIIDIVICRHQYNRVYFAATSSACYAIAISRDV